MLLKIHSSLLAKNTALNFIGQVASLLVGIIAIPFIIRGLGTERFGIFSLAGVILGYFSVLDLGLGRATTKFVAEVLGKGQVERIQTIVWTSLIFIAGMSFFGAVLLSILTPFLVGDVLNVSPDLIAEAKFVFYVLSFSILITLTTATFCGVLEAYQRFDLINFLRIPSDILTYLIPVIALLFGAGLPLIILLITIKNLMILVCYGFLSLRIMPSGRSFFSIDFKIASSLFTFGGWVALHNVFVYILMYADRFLIGGLLTMTAVTYYTVPYGLTSRLLIVPSSMVTVLFPAFSTLQALDREKLELLFSRSLKYLIIIMGLIALTFVVFSKEILVLWLGSDFAKSATVFQILSIGAFLCSIASLCGTLLQGVGYPKIVTIIHAPQVPLYLLISWFLIKKIGIEGAALAWSLRMLITVILLFVYCINLKLFKPPWLLQKRLIHSVFIISLISMATFMFKSFFGSSLFGLLTIFLIFTISNFLIVWYYTLDNEGRNFILHTIKKLNLKRS